MKDLEEALLAVSDGVQKVKDYEKSYKPLRSTKKIIATDTSYTDVRGRTQGMDFIQVRKEI
jgi:hypothetical protein